MQLLPEEIARYSQQIKLPQLGLTGQRKLKNARVLCIGAGGLGSSLLLYLAAAGVGNIGIVDDDEVAVSNLQRQILYQQSHLSLSKANVAKHQLSALNPYITIDAYPVRLTLEQADNLIHHYDIIADCTDNFATRYLINDICYQRNKPFVFASISQFKGQCSLFLGKQSPCLRCLFPTISKPGSMPNCAEGGVLGVLPGLMGILQATEILKYLLNLDEMLNGKLLTVDILKNAIQGI